MAYWIDSCMFVTFHKNVMWDTLEVIMWQLTVCGNCWDNSVRKIIIFLTWHNIYNCNNISYCSPSFSQFGWITLVPTNIFIFKTSAKDKIILAVKEIYHIISTHCSNQSRNQSCWALINGKVGWPVFWAFQQVFYYLENHIFAYNSAKSQ